MKFNIKPYFLLSFALFAFIFIIIFYLKNNISYLNPLFISSGKIENSSDTILAKYYQSDTSNITSAFKISNWEHITLKVSDNLNEEFLANSLRKSDKKKNLLFTVEIWGSKTIPNYWGNPLDKIIEGKFDKLISKLCVLLNETKQDIYIRFNPEMEIPIGKYPWQRSGDVYVKAYRHFAKICRKSAPNVKLVWGPAGYPGAIENYPGDDVVDITTFTIDSDSELKAPWHPKEESTTLTVYRKIQRLRFIKKPILILGSSNFVKSNFNNYDITNALEIVRKHKNSIYLNEKYNFEISDKLNKNNRNLQIGLYDPQSALINQPQITTEHIFIDFYEIQRDHVKSILEEIELRGHNIIITLEPWNGVNKVNDKNVLNNILLGKYDSLFTKLYDEISQLSTKVYLRFGHEMEIPIKRYTWQSQDPSLYIEAYRYFMLFPKTPTHNIKRIWGPAGDRGSLEWWPGNDVVDYISIAIYGLPDKNITDPNKQESFKTILNRKLWRMRFIDKPIFITEFGVKGSMDYQTNWLKKAAVSINEESRIEGICYFNMTDTPKAWGDIKPPVWSISKETLQNFTNSLKL